MTLADLVAGYAVAVGVLVGGMWGISLARGSVPELRTKPWEIRHHITAEALLAAALVAGGVLALVDAAAGPPLLVLGLGMALYSIVNSSGYYVQRRQLAPVAMFAVLFVITVAAAVVAAQGMAGT